MANTKNRMQHPRALILLILLQLLVDTLFVFIYPSVNPVRATLIGITIFIILWIPFLRRMIGLPPWIGFLPIYSSALGGALLVQAGILVSKSALSGIVHVLILIVTYIIIVAMRKKKEK